MDQENPTNPNPCPVGLPRDHCPRCAFYLNNYCHYPQLILWLSICEQQWYQDAYAPLTKK
ncbi:unnamed protein product [marine sediment metagenome]|uniref:Uncharacterized protein n=1 Tax=marine sediment metagenome TaxID=412755 RepID=X1F6P1_9ZZZZ